MIQIPTTNEVVGATCGVYLREQFRPIRHYAIPPAVLQELLVSRISNFVACSSGNWGSKGIRTTGLDCPSFGSPRVFKALAISSSVSIRNLGDSAELPTLTP